MNILITGANGFVGSALIPELVDEKHHVIALSRDKKKKSKKSDGVKWIEGDLLKPESLPELGKLDKVFYFVHGLKADARDFEYQEAMAAVNFLNWIRPTGAGVVYLGGLGEDDKPLSPHLRSRHLTGAILGSSGLSVIEFRASIILGAGSLSFEMIKALAERIPFRPDLTLLDKPCQPLALADLLKYLIGSLALSPEGHEIIEIGGPEITSYGNLLDLYAELSNLRRKKVKVPEVEAKVLMKALDYAVPEYAQAGKKLTESLMHPTVVTTKNASTFFPDIKPMDLRVSMDLACSNSKTQYPSLWEKDFLKGLLSDKILTQSGLLSPELLRNLERVGKFKDLFMRK